MAAYQTGSTGVWLPQQTSNISRVRDVRVLLLPSGGHACAMHAQCYALVHLLTCRYVMWSGGHCPILCLGGGTPHKPAVLGANGHVIHEATACARYLRNKVRML